MPSPKEGGLYFTRREGKTNNANWGSGRSGTRSSEPKGKGFSSVATNCPRLTINRHYDLLRTLHMCIHIQVKRMSQQCEERMRA
ncbi:hypothetical protein GOBAR_AA35010 [Gossypium barbadense]|uniref:Uncharacterized protein n=1 Tax=Gossypium barbadense TaxID=3634 RepID=A0A2P5W3L5_GOSBA|nr:hypothetical protein GOBAR_AA35010 [Gossypium barbadense]